jgi:hypothetical protein
VVEPAQAGLGVGDDGSERLAHFVGDRSGQLTQRRHAHDMRELGLSSVQLLLSLFRRGEIHQRANEFQLAPMISYNMGNDMNVFDRAIRHQQSIFIIEILPLPRCAVDRPLHESPVFRMHTLKDHVDSDGARLVISKNSEAFL